MKKVITSILIVLLMPLSVFAEEGSSQKVVSHSVNWPILTVVFALLLGFIIWKKKG
ncbi:MAG: hypothetical protein ABII07_02135 [Patescibacteria group bacterium]|nr:hypothetical protein [Patescibacteria group bacterium]